MNTDADSIMITYFKYVEYIVLFSMQTPGRKEHVFYLLTHQSHQMGASVARCSLPEGVKAACSPRGFDACTRKSLQKMCYQPA